MGYVVLATPERTHVVGVHHINHQWRMHADGRMQGRRGCPGLVADASHIFTFASGAVEWNLAAVAGKNESLAEKPLHLHLQAFHG